MRNFYRSQEAGWSASHKRTWLADLERDVFPAVGKVAVDKIGVREVLAAIEPHWVLKHETASRNRGRIEKVLDYAKAMRHRAGDINPASWKGNLSEVRDAQWSEIDLEARVWTIPKDRMKAGREHVVPLTDRAVEILKGLNREGEDIFDLGRDDMIGLTKSLGGSVTVHGFRAAFSTWAGEKTAFPRDIVERCIAHATGSAVEQAYRRGAELDRRRAVLDAWAAFLARGSSSGQIVDLRVA